MPKPAAIPDLTVPEVAPEEEIPGDEEIQTYDLLEVQPLMPTSAVIPEDEFMGPQSADPPAEDIVQSVARVENVLTG